ncbi:cytochrome d ubiquinol oxidase subunit II [Mucilaginibacter angelicae]|uniref:Cytochrome d ubiquinol oxidase subunit II n=1 Tax=Mucilaginibacter angelicae TaxID=869718 RepID=A0ABV6L143_9SPHI
MDIHIVWALIIVFAVLMYTIFDGFDLGAGSLLLFFKNEKERDTIVDTITPVWDGNESWIVLAGVGLFGGFPNAYATLLPALYIPVIVMIISLALRGVSMEFRFLASSRRRSWDMVFSVASVLASLCQGIILGNLLEGIRPRSGADLNTTDPFYFLTPFTLCTGIIVLLLYMVIGANWLNFKTDRLLQHRVRRVARVVLVLTVFLAGLVLAARKYLYAFQPRFQFHGDYDGLSVPFPVWISGAALMMLGIYYCLKLKNDKIPFLLNIFLFVYLGVFVISHLWPFIVAPVIRIHDAGAPLYGNTVLLYGALIVIPVILSYLLYSYYVFKGKTGVSPDYDPKLTDEQEDLKQDSGLNPENRVPVKLNLAIKIFLKLFWLALFFIILGFLGDFTALGTAVLFIILFCAGWYRTSRNENTNAKEL